MGRNSARAKRRLHSQAHSTATVAFTAQVRSVRRTALPKDVLVRRERRVPSQPRARALARSVPAQEARGQRLCGARRRRLSAAC